mgnify:FL=1
MDYNKTINLPKTDFPMRAGLPKREPEMLKRWEDMDLYNELLNKDWFMTLLDLEDYITTKDRMFADYEDQEKWKRMMVVNIAKAGFFSSDRTIAEYNRDIWKLK